jgi:ankyrin repeat protein
MWNGHLSGMSVFVLCLVSAMPGGCVPAPTPPAATTQVSAPEAAFEAAVQNQDAVELNRLLNLRRPEGIDSLLIRAAGVGNLTLVRMLIQHGANPNTGVNGVNETPLIEAARIGGSAVADVLLKAGANPDGRAGPQQCCTPLYFAVATRDLGVVSLLLSAKANPDLRIGFGFQGEDFSNEDGPTPLMIAASLGEVDIVEALLRAGANPRLVDSGGRTARDWLKRFVSPVGTIDRLLKKTDVR